MNKNTITAFLIILGTVIFFTSPTYNKFYTEKILKKEYKAEKNEQKKLNEKKENKIEIKEEEKTDEKEEKKENETKKIEKTCDTIWIENEKIIVGIKEEGAIITNIFMKEYKYSGKNEKRIIDLIEEGGEGGCQLIIGNKRYDKEIFKYYGKEKRVKVRDKNKEIEFIKEEENGEKVIKKYSLGKNEYKIMLTVIKDNLPGEKIGIGWFCGIKESEKTKQKNMVEKKVVHYYNGENVEHISMSKEGKEEPSGRYQWLGVTSKYFFVAINNENIVDMDLKIIAEKTEKEKNINYKMEMTKIAEKREEKFLIYAGPTKREELKKYNLKYEKILFPVLGWGKIFFWSEKWFPWLAEMVLMLLIGIQKIFKDWGISILILTIITKIVTFPMTMSSMKSMEKMKNIQPKVDKIRQKNKNNPQKMNEEIMVLYKKEGVNPLNPGCLPMFLQMPVFFSLFIVLRKSIEIRGATTIIIPWISDLSQAEVLISLEKIIPNGIPMYGTNVALLPIINAILTFFSQKMTIKDPNQKAMIYFMPLFMLVIFNSFSSGLVLYWTFQSALQLIQQILLNKKNKV